MSSGDWPHHAFKFLLTTHFAGDWGADVGESDIDLPCVRVADFERTTSSLAEEIPTVRSYAEKTVERKHLKFNDLLVEKSGGGEKTPVGSVVLYQGDDNALCANFIEVMRLNCEQYPPFWAYVFRANFVDGATFRFVKQTTGIQNLDMQMFLDQVFAVPPLEQQHRIADYLDTEVGEMDAMVARLESLIADLEARRAKVIGYTLSEHAESASGEWPHHAFKFLLTTHFAGDWGADVGQSDLDLPCVRVADFERTTSSLAEEIPTVRSYAEKTVERKHLEYNDLLVEKSGGGEKTPVGSVVLYQGADNALCANFIEVMRLNGDQYPPFWVHMFRANFVDGETFRFVKQTTGIQNLDMQMFLDQVFVVPPLEQQCRIAAELDEETAAIDGIITRSRTLIDDLKARKSALITEVVTGRKQV